MTEAAASALRADWPRRPGLGLWIGRPDLVWAVAFILPYLAVLLTFVCFPIGYGIAMASQPSLYTELFSSPLYLTTLGNTLVYVGLAVNVKMVLALLLSGFFMRRRVWIKALLVVFMLPWAMAAIPAFVSIHWMVIGERGFLNTLLRELTGIEGPLWLNHRSLALGADIVAYIWKWLPFWTLVLLAGRMAIPPDIYEAADVDGATGIRRFLHITWPLLANLYLISTLLSAIWTLGDFTTVYLVSGGGPALTTEVLATLANRYSFDFSQPAMGVAAVVSALPILIPVAVVLMRRVQLTGVQL